MNQWTNSLRRNRVHNLIQVDWKEVPQKSKMNSKIKTTITYVIRQHKESHEWKMISTGKQQRYERGD